MQKSEIKTGIIIGTLISLAALSRLADHPMNFTPMAAILLFCAAYISNKYLKFIIPFAVILFSDIALELVTGWGFHSGTWVVYLGYALIFSIGYLFLQKVSVVRTATASVLGSVVFFLLTNFAFFYKESPVSNPLLGQYSHDLTGIFASYEAGLPFFRNMLVGDLFFSGLLFGGYFLVKNFGRSFSKAN